MKAPIRLNRFPRALAAIVAAAVVVVLPPGGSAFGRRATEAEMDRATKPLNVYFRNIRASYRAVDGLILKRGKADAQQIVARLSKQRDLATAPLDKAIYSYLLARAYYWRGFHQFKATRNRHVFADLRPKVVGEYLNAFKNLRSAEKNRGTTQAARKDIIGAFASALGTNLWGAKLSSEEKRRVVAQFVNVVEKMPDRGRLLPAGKRLARMYRNLGIEGRLGRMIPEELPTEYEKLAALLEKVRNVAPPEQLLPIVAAMERDHKEMFEKQPGRLALVAVVHESNGRLEKAFEYLTRAAAQSDEYYLALHMLSFRPELKVPREERDCYLDRFIEGSCTPEAKRADRTGRKYVRKDAYANATAALMRARRYEECLALIARYEKDASFQRGILEPINILLTKARCLDKLGRTQAAVAAYEAFVEKSADFPSRYGHTRARARRRIKRLGHE